MGPLSGKVIIVTGGARGLGLAQAQAFCAAGASVLLNDRGTGPDGAGADPTLAEAAAASLPGAVANTDDPCTRAGAERIVADAVARFGRVDGLLHNAGWVRDAPLLEVDDETFAFNTEGLLNGTFRITQTVARQMVAQGGGGRILLTSSIVGLVGSAGLPSYGAAKAGIYGFARVASMDLQPHGIAVNVLSPIAYTRLTAGLPIMQMPGAETLFAPSLVADVSTFLFSEAAAELTGAVVEVQGRQVSVVRMSQGVGALPESGDRWTLDELKARWSELAR